MDAPVALYDGAMTGAYLDGDPRIVGNARRAAGTLLRDAAAGDAEQPAPAGPTD